MRFRVWSGNGPDDFLDCNPKDLNYSESFEDSCEAGIRHIDVDTLRKFVEKIQKDGGFWHPKDDLFIPIYNIKAVQKMNNEGKYSDPIVRFV